ncbi:MAG: hypothetical protein FJ088_13240, partial [Deltaproteobacteria bacterium]|nr:hypothetical protein [Deltaproteobacteria bacterium]
MFFRKTYILHAIISVIFTALGAPDLLASPLINVQGILEDSKGTPVNGKFDMEFRIYDKKIGGSELWGEKLEEVEVKDGIFGVYLGTDTLLTADIFAGDEPVYLGLIVGSGSEFPREQLVYLPYAVVSEEALHAAECGVLLGAAPDLDCDGCVDASELPGNVCYLDNAQTFTGSKSFDKPVAFDALGVSPFSVKSGV